MDCLRNYFLAGSRLAREKDRGAAWRYLADEVEDAQHSLAFSHNVREAVALFECPFELLVLTLQAGFRDHVADLEPGRAYERQLASTLLSDTRLYRLAAEERGLKSVARVMGDLELVLLQTSMSSNPEPATLQQIQRLIHKRDLVTKMDVVVSGF